MRHHNPSSLWTIPSPYAGVFSHAVETQHGGLRELHIAGQVGIAPNGVCALDFTPQCEQAMANVEAALASAGMGLQDLVRLTYYLVDRVDLPALNALRLSRWSGVRPACTVLVVAGLVRPEHRIEIEGLSQRSG